MVFLGRATRAGTVAAALLLAALAQGSLIARLSWPGPGEPQLPALAVLAVALTAGPRAGAVAGFGTGLVLDVLPPATHALGQWAFVLCLLGYLVGVLAQDAADSALLAVAIGAVGAALAPLAFTIVGFVLADPRAHFVTALEHLPSVALWTLVVAVFVLGPVCRRADRRVSVDALPALVSLGAR